MRSLALTVLLLALPAGVLACLGLAADGGRGAAIGLVVALVLGVLTYLLGDRLALAMVRARPYPACEGAVAATMLEELAAQAGLPAPRLRLMDDSSVMACAVGRNPAHGAIAVTSGLLAQLNAREMRAVLALGLAQIARRDSLPATVGAVLAGAILLPATLLRFGRPPGRPGERGRGEPIGLLVLLLVLLPPAALFLHATHPHARQHAADAHAARLCGDPAALADALGYAAQMARLQPPAIALAAAPLCIVHPFAAVGLLDLLDTHPPLAARLARLEGLAGASPPGGVAED